MSNKITTLIAIAAAGVLGILIGWWLSGAVPESSGDATTAEGEREILYWVAPMDPNYRRDEPGKSPMGMDLVPVYADSGSAGPGDQPSIRINPAVINNIGVKTAAVERGTLYRNIETVGYIAPDDDLFSHVHVRAEGWIEQLETATEGDRVQQGGLLFRIYSPALVSAQDEYLQALRIAQPSLARAAETRLRALGMSPAQIEVLKNRREAQQLFDVRSPQDGYVIKLNVREGMFVQPGTTIMSLADLSRVWVDVDVFENQIDWVEVGQMARVKMPFAPNRVWHGEVEYVYPTIRPTTRSARVRLTFANPDLMLKPEMYAAVEIDAAPQPDVLFVPAQAVIRQDGQERVVLALGEGRFRPAEVRTGIESEGRVEIINGLTEGERIVVSSQFLIDSEASMDASLLRMIGQDAPARALPREQGRDENEIDHSGHDMEGMDQDAGGSAP